MLPQQKYLFDSRKIVVLGTIISKDHLSIEENKQ